MYKAEWAKQKAEGTKWRKSFLEKIQKPKTYLDYLKKSDYRYKSQYMKRYNDWLRYEEIRLTLTNTNK